MRNSFPALPKKGKKTLSRHATTEYYHFILTCTDVSFAFKVYVGLLQASISTASRETLSLWTTSKTQWSQLKRACCWQIFWWGDIKQVPWIIFPTVLSEHSASQANFYHGYNPAVYRACTQWAIQKYTSKLMHVYACSHAGE